jgi:exopolysaccharide biosynthesis polyprenyl glycosylphosphotransferase
MLYHNVQVTAHSLRFIDPVALASSAAATWYFGLSSDYWSIEWHGAVVVYLVVSFLAFLAMGSRFRIYHARRTEEVANELIVLCEVAIYAAALGCLATQVFTQGLPGNAYVAMLAAGLAVMLGLRLAMRLAIRNMRRRGDDTRNWLIVGHNAAAAELASDVLRNPHYGIRVEQILDIAHGAQRHLSERRRFAAKVPPGVPLSVTDDVERVREIVAERVIDEVVVTLPVRSHYDTVSQILDICCAAGISVKLPPGVFDKPGYATELSYIGKIPMVTHYSGPASYRLLLLKRTIDVIGATIGLVALLPLFAVVAVLIKNGSPGPVFFRQTRVGLHGRHFEMIKFRSMVKDALAQREKLAGQNQRDGTAFKIRHDSRITPIGRWLRKYHIDELPQLWNVLVGDMSLVGPRPLPVKEAQGNEWWQRRRLTMPPGLTCLWQLEDDPTMPFRDWMSLDIAYIDHWSVWLDLKLIMRTFVTVLRGNGW